MGEGEGVSLQFARGQNAEKAPRTGTLAMQATLE